MRKIKHHSVSRGISKATTSLPYQLQGLVKQQPPYHIGRRIDGTNTISDEGLVRQLPHYPNNRGITRQLPYTPSIEG